MSVFIFYNTIKSKPGSNTKVAIQHLFTESPLYLNDINALLQSNAKLDASSQICRGGINMKYITTLIKQCPITLIYAADESPEDILGFAILDVEINSSSLHIVFICAKQLAEHKNIGKILIDSCKLIAHTLELKSIHVSSVKNAVGFYQKMGFTYGRVDYHGNIMLAEQAPSETGSTGDINMVFEVI